MRRASMTAATDGESMMPGSDGVHRDAAARDLQRQRPHRADETGLGRGIVGLAAIAHDRGDRRDGDDTPPARRHHRQQQRPRDGIEAVQRHIDDAAPLLFRHARQRRVVMDAGAVHQNLRNAIRQHAMQRGLGAGDVGEVAGPGLR